MNYQLHAINSSQGSLNSNNDCTNKMNKSVPQCHQYCVKKHTIHTIKKMYKTTRNNNKKLYSETPAIKKFSKNQTWPIKKSNKKKFNDKYF